MTDEVMLPDTDFLRWREIPISRETRDSLHKGYVAVSRLAELLDCRVFSDLRDDLGFLVQVYDGMPGRPSADRTTCADCGRYTLAHATFLKQEKGFFPDYCQCPTESEQAAA